MTEMMKQLDIIPAIVKEKRDVCAIMATQQAMESHYISNSQLCIKKALHSKEILKLIIKNEKDHSERPVSKIAKNYLVFT